MARSDAWRCQRCDTLNLRAAGACRRCGLSRAPAAAAAPRHDHAGLAATLSMFAPGLGQAYTGRLRQGLLIVVLPLTVLAATLTVLLLLDPLMAAALRAGVLLAAIVVVALGVYHIAVTVDAFAARTTRGRGLLGKSRPEYAVLALTVIVLVLLYAVLFRQATAWAALAERVFEPFHRGEDPAAEETAPPWTGSERLNILLLGLDVRAGAPAEALNTDTIIVLSIDPLNRTAAMLSIPRDTLVSIPGAGDEKINAAYAIGGASLARRTVSRFLEVPIHAHALVTFDGFQRTIAALGGVILDAPLPVRDELYPTEDFGVTRVHIRAGPQHMDGETALRYSRSRHGSNDFSRAERQQRLLVAMKVRADRTGAILRLPGLVDELSDAVRTDLEPGNMLPLAALMGHVRLEDIEREVLMPPSERGPGQLREVNLPTGYYLIPDQEAVRELVARLFYDPTARSAP